MASSHLLIVAMKGTLPSFPKPGWLAKNLATGVCVLGPGASNPNGIDVPKGNSSSNRGVSGALLVWERVCFVQINLASIYILKILDSPWTSSEHFANHLRPSNKFQSTPRNMPAMSSAIFQPSHHLGEKNVCSLHFLPPPLFHNISFCVSRHE